MDKNRIQGANLGRVAAVLRSPLSIERVKRRFGGCDRKVVGLTSGDLHVCPRGLGGAARLFDRRAEVSRGHSRWRYSPKARTVPLTRSEEVNERWTAELASDNQQRNSGHGLPGDMTSEASNCRRRGLRRSSKANVPVHQFMRRRRLDQPNRRVREPYARWCGRAGAARLPPIPIDERRSRYTGAPTSGADRWTE